MAIEKDIVCWLFFFLSRSLSLSTNFNFESIPWSQEQEQTETDPSPPFLPKRKRRNQKQNNLLVSFSRPALYFRFRYSPGENWKQLSYYYGWYNTFLIVWFLCSPFFAIGNNTVVVFCFGRTGIPRAFLSLSLSLEPIISDSPSLTRTHYHSLTLSLSLFLPPSRF